MYYVYLLRCSDTSLYTGITNDLDRRLAAHKAGTASRYTRSRGALRFEYIERKRTKGNALKREAAIKKLSRSDKLALIRTVRSSGKVGKSA
ncbi:MAG: GIY-YIG nuclease family protein [Candidatus Pacebacteria bacterium]|nr:GIY-YIG nuclease family protein [Candidatus Paceibacterota bacterium]